MQSLTVLVLLSLLQSWISRLGIPIINAYGRESGNVHAPNEWLNLRTIEPVFQSYWASLVQFCPDGEY